MNRSHIIRVLFAIRTLPDRFRRRGDATAAPSGPFLDAALAAGLRVLEEDLGREILVGAVTQPWAPVVRFRGLSGADFLAFDEPGFTKIAWNIALRPAPDGGAILSTETRVSSTDPESRRRFRRCWLLFGGGIRLIRAIAQRLVRRDPEASRREPFSWK